METESSTEGCLGQNTEEITGNFFSREEGIRGGVMFVERTTK